MFRRAEFWIVAALAALLAGAALLGKATAAPGMSNDPRLSTRLHGPNGASAFRRMLEGVGVDVTERRRPFFDLDRSAADRRVLLALLEPSAPLTAPEIAAVRNYVARGGQVLLVGATRVERCFGWTVTALPRMVRVNAREGVMIQPTDSVASGPMPAPLGRLRRIAEDAEDDEGTPVISPLREACPSYAPADTRSLWDAGKDTAAVRLIFPSGGQAVLVADATVFTNRLLRTTGAGPTIFTWLPGHPPRAVMIDEYHHGFGTSGSLTAAAAGWAFRTPAGWMMLQLVAAGLVALGLAAVRFGPVIPAVERRRRSPLEHLDALASGLERSHSARTAVRLLVAGLRRRLSRGTVRSTADTEAWLARLVQTARTPATRAAAERLRRAARDATDANDVVKAATAVEDVWQTLKLPVSATS